MVEGPTWESQRSAPRGGEGGREGATKGRKGGGEGATKGREGGCNLGKKGRKPLEKKGERVHLRGDRGGFCCFESE